MFWRKSSNNKIKRLWRELLRENLNTITIDTFYINDPVVKLPPEERKLYLKHFEELSKDQLLMDRIKYLINRQANLTLSDFKKIGGNKDTKEMEDMAGAMNINGMSLIRDDIVNLAVMFAKENLPPPKMDFSDRFKI